MRILNLGCGTKVSGSPDMVNIDWGIYLRLKRRKILRPIIPFILKGRRLERYHSLPDNIMVHNLAKGIPFDSESVDAVYHSHLLEHLDMEVAMKFMQEIKRVLKPGGIHRIVVPDLEKACRAYIEHIAASEANTEESDNHDSFVAQMLEQCVRRESVGTRTQGPLRRFVENALLGNARRRGETHQWMYDRINLKAKLLGLGFTDVLVQDFNNSRIPNWAEYGLEVDNDGNQYKAHTSLYVEAIK